MRCILLDTKSVQRYESMVGLCKKGTYPSFEVILDDVALRIRKAVLINI